MRRSLLILLLAFPILGCGRSAAVPTAKFFGGETIDHWLGAVRGPDAKVRKKAADVLGNVGSIDPRAVAALAVAVGDADARVRDAAVLGLSKIGPPAVSAEAVLERATKDKDPTVRAHAAAALKRVRGEP